MSSNCFNADADYKAGNSPWTFFAFPKSLADEAGLPPDDDARRLLAELRRRDLPVSPWMTGPAEDTVYFACPKEAIKPLHDAIEEMEASGIIEVGFCGKRSEALFAKVQATPL